MIILDSIYCFIIYSLFCYCSMKPKKLLFWLELMEFDVDKKCFAKLKFNKSDSQLFTKVFAISITLVWRFTHLCVYSIFFFCCSNSYLFVSKRIFFLLSHLNNLFYLSIAFYFRSSICLVFWLYFK